jgi:hypothetical protein
VTAQTHSGGDRAGYLDHLDHLDQPYGPYRPRRSTPPILLLARCVYAAVLVAVVLGMPSLLRWGAAFVG